MDKKNDIEFLKKFFEKHLPEIKQEKTFSIFEVILYVLLSSGLEKAKKNKIKDPKKVALFVLGYLSARLSINAIEDLISHLTTGIISINIPDNCRKELFYGIRKK